MELNKLYDVAEKEKIEIYNYQIENCEGMFLHYNNFNVIALNNKLIKTTKKEIEVLAEELGHYYMNATYPPNTDNIELISRQEFRAKKWSYLVLIPIEEIKKAVKKGNKNIDELADYFDVTDKFMQEALFFYFENGYIQQNEFYNTKKEN